MKFLKRIAVFAFISALPSITVATTMCWVDFNVDPSDFMLGQTFAFIVAIVSLTYPYE